MRNILKAAIVVFGAVGALSAIPASAQPYGAGYDGYDNGYDANGPYGEDEDTGYCDPYYGCPDDYYDQPVYYGQVYWGDEWFDGPIYYRDWGGGRQFWIHGGWRSTNQFRGGRFGSALGRSWYNQHRSEFRGLYNHGGGGYRGQQNGYGNRGVRNYGNYRDYSQRGVGGASSFQSQAAPQTRGNDDWRGRWSNRQGFGQNGFGQGGQRGFQQQQAAPQQQRGFGGGGHAWQGRQNAQPQAAPQAAPQQPAGGRGDGGGHGGHGDRGGRGERN